jgi:hypothetical protein
MPRQIGFLADDELYARIEEYRFKNRMRSIKEVMHYLLEYALDDLEEDED